MNVNVAFSAPEIHAGILPLVCHTHTRTHTRAHAHGHTHRRACMRRVWSRRLCGIATAACVVPGRCVAKAGLTRGCAHQLWPAVMQQCWRTDRATRHWCVDHRHLNRPCRRRRREIASLACAARRGRFVRCARVRWHRTFNAKKREREAAVRKPWLASPSLPAPWRRRDRLSSNQSAARLSCKATRASTPKGIWGRFHEPAKS